LSHLQEFLDFGKGKKRQTKRRSMKLVGKSITPQNAARGVPQRKRDQPERSKRKEIGEA
jgi:hypothetical protein